MEMVKKLAMMNFDIIGLTPPPKMVVFCYHFHYFF